MRLQIETVLLSSVLMVVAATTSGHEDSTKVLTLLQREEYESHAARQLEADSDVPISFLALQKRGNQRGVSQGNPKTFRLKATDTTPLDSSNPPFNSQRDINSRLPWRSARSVRSDLASGSERGEEAKESPSSQGSGGSDKGGGWWPGQGNSIPGRFMQQPGRDPGGTSRGGLSSKPQQGRSYSTSTKIRQTNTGSNYRDISNVIQTDSSPKFRSYVPTRPHPPPIPSSQPTGAPGPSSAEQAADSSADPLSSRVSGGASSGSSREAANGSEKGPSGSGSYGSPRGLRW